jgi:hypothetical protein
MGIEKKDKPQEVHPSVEQHTVLDIPASAQTT